MAALQPSYPELLETMIVTALEAGRIVHDIYCAGFKVEQKADRTPVTDADRAAETRILERLRAVAPSIPIVAEEEVASGRMPVVGTEFFLVDPLDGTREFIERRGDFTVNIALVRHGTPVLGVVYAPATARLFGGDARAREAFEAEHEPGSEIRAPRQSIRVRPAPTQGLTVVSSRSHSTPETEQYLASYTVVERVSVGSSLKFCLVANAQADLYPRLGPTMEWDTAAGHAVLLAAGGSVWAPGGVPLRYGKPGFRNTFFVAAGTLTPQPLPV